MTQFKENAWTDRRTEEQKDGQTLFYRILPATGRGPIVNFYSPEIIRKRYRFFDDFSGNRS